MERRVRESMLQEKLNGKVRCNICERRCTIVDGGKGWCRTRENRNGRLVTLTYASVSSLFANPIEKKPFYHFHPGTRACTVGSWSCNFGCPWCQNWEISKLPTPRRSDEVSPARMIQVTEKTGCTGTSISFNEPTLSLEWSLEVFRLARHRRLYNTFVTNGYMTPEALGLLIDAGLDAMNVDLKGEAAEVKRFCKGIDVEKVWATCRLARSRGVHLELTTLVIPTVNAAEATLRGIARRIATDLGPEVPWHVSGYHPCYRFTVPATTPALLERAWEIGKEAGLEFVYVGNLAGHRHEDTTCPGCNATLIRRLGFEVLSNALLGGRCPRCGRLIAGTW